jgi:PAS domain-containing protein
VPGQIAQRSLVMILARDFASRLATAVFLVDAEGTLVYFNEAAERLLGRTFVEGRGMDRDEWSTIFTPVDERGAAVGLEELPLGIAISQRTPAHRHIGIRGMDGVERDLEVTAFPLFAHTDQFLGAIAFFWQTAGTE